MRQNFLHPGDKCLYLYLDLLLSEFVVKTLEHITILRTARDLQQHLWHALAQACWIEEAPLMISNIWFPSLKDTPYRVVPPTPAQHSVA